MIGAGQDLTDTCQRKPFLQGVCSPIVAAERALKLVKDAVVLVEVAQFLTQMVVDIDCLDRLVLHGDIPDFECEVIARQDVLSVLAKLHV